MRKLILITGIFLSISCSNFGQLKIISDLPKSLDEVSGIEITNNTNIIWMLNDGGNAPQLYAITPKGKIEKVIEVDADNEDWEDITSDNEGNLYIGDFGNNNTSRDDLVILKVNANTLKKDKIDVEKISFEYPEEQRSRVKKKKFTFDSESIIWYDNYLYIFTKNRKGKEQGKTHLFKVPAKPGSYVAEYIDTFRACEKKDCHITGADISADFSKIVLLTHDGVWLLSNYTGDAFFKGSIRKLSFDHVSQKEGVCFKNDSTLYITDEYAHGSGGNLYEFALD